MQPLTYTLRISSLLIAALFVGCGPKFTEESKEGFNLVHNENGASLGYSPNSEVNILTVDRLAFKDLNKNGSLDSYEDWRLAVDDRAKDLASKMSVEQIAGLMLYSAHQSIPGGGNSFFGPVTYNGKPYAESGAEPSDLSDAQMKFLQEDNLRHVLITSVESPGIAAQWNNNAQALVEGIGLGIPINTSSDPRHGSDSYAEFNAGAGGQISMWPSTLGLAASFDPSLMQEFGKIASKEYRALGIATALSPQIDLATEPRWSRFDGTMGEDPKLAADMARAYVEGFQASENGDWGSESVNAMVKHWPGGGPEEGGRDAHFGYGSYAVYPGNNLEDHLKPFIEGAFDLEGPTKMAAAVMPYYTISYNQDTKNGENVGNAYNKYLITDLLREKYGYDGVVCTDWGITSDAPNVYEFRGKPWGVENLSVAERHYKIIEAGCDQFGGNNEMGPVIEAYQLGVEEHGEEYMRNRFERSAVRLLKNIFRTGLFENPYLDVSETEQIVGNAEFMQAGYNAQLKSVVMLKNSQETLPMESKKKVYVPQRYVAPAVNWFGIATPERTEHPFNMDVVSKYFEVVEEPADADFALVGVQNPNGGVGYDIKDKENGGNGYVPISLQYGPYTATQARESSLAAGSPLEDVTDRSYKDKTITAANIADMALVTDTKRKMGDKPVIVIVKVAKPLVFAEIEPASDAILIHMGVQDQALMDIISGKVEPSALLPFQMPKDMMTVETQFEDVPRDMDPYKDTNGNNYDFGFGLNWKGVIDDARVELYK
ncbi:MAG: glycoside hydrolase family 3 N-terminal domain-containing protein [Bacteroidota bacterium]|uniref:beta-glucosidase n=1 Tax=Flagellimonas profundi TaxID=2915620 RepID=A0ABS3FBW9_9FLAO|nr:glycoside hydrolase family 3 N-terminal domain-containing protein [Allomuricauda profundi]MBO0340471.1 glycoside hydrolase family 3 C-terminal domain-containing protein [Allomuricauda profundi]MEC7770227.1 glycoside hydrolase family 3 N-terminal domain-containing protein [Bacteroidota bacterium]